MKKKRNPIPVQPTEEGPGKIWPYFLLAAFSAIFFWDGLIGHQVFCLRDTFIQILGWPQMASRTLATPELFPLWNPFRGFGKPYIADPEAGFFYPLNWIYWFFSTPATGLALFTSLSIFIAGASTYALARHWKLSIFPALISAVSLMFSTWVIASIEFRALFSTFIWGPVELLLVSHLIERFHAKENAGLWKNFALLVALSLIMTLQFLPGYVQTLLYTQLMIGFYIVARCYWLRSWPALIGTVKFCLVAGVITAGLSMAQLLPSIEFIKYSERGLQVDPGLDMASMLPRHLWSLIFPFLFGRTGYPHEYWATTIYEFWIGTCYVGIVPLLLLAFAPLCLTKPFRDPARPYVFLLLCFGVITVIGLIMAMGKYTPLYMLLYSWVPGFNHFRWPSKFLVFVLYALSIVGGIGFQMLLDARGNEARKRQIKISAGICVTLLAAIGLLYAMAASGREVIDQLTAGSFIFTPEHYLQVLRDFREAFIFAAGGFAAILVTLSSRVKPIVGSSALVLVAFINLWVISRQIHPIMDGKVYEYRAMAIAKKVSPVDSSMVFSTYADIGQFLYGNHDPAAWEWAREAGTNSTLQPQGIFQTYQDGLKLQRHLILFQILGQLQGPEQARLLDLLGIRFVITGENPDKILWGDLPRKVDVVERPGAQPKAFLVNRWYVVKDLMDGARRAIDPLFDPRNEAVIEPEGASLPTDNDRSQSEANPDTQKILSLQYTWNSVTVKAVTDHRALLVVNDTWYPGWVAMVDGTPQPIVRTNLNFRGVFLEKGEHTVVFQYDPWQFRAGLTVSLATIAIILLLLAWRYKGLVIRNEPAALSAS